MYSVLKGSTEEWSLKFILTCRANVQVDQKNESLLVPIYGLMVPFHILTVKNVSNNQVSVLCLQKSHNCELPSCHRNQSYSSREPASLTDV